MKATQTEIINSVTLQTEIIKYCQKIGSGLCENKELPGS
jgi:hypothetical protein